MTSLIGKKLGNYRLISRSGKGGFAEVYLGQHIYLGTFAAIKVLKMCLGDDASACFLKEARTIAHLDHPHIVRVLEFGIQEYTPYLVMNYAWYGTLRQQLSRGKCQTPARILPLVMQLASALQYAHSRGIIHRDIKPENMLVGRHREILLSDFGLAMVAASDSKQRSLQTTAGTMAYMAPEQLQGKPTYASDQYALAVTIYEWLCGSQPFRGDNKEIAVHHAHFLPPTLSEMGQPLLPAIEEVLMKALAKDPGKRFPSVQAFADTFAQVCMSATSPTRDSSTSSLPFVGDNSMSYSGSYPPFQGGFLANQTQPVFFENTAGHLSGSSCSSFSGNYADSSAHLPLPDALADSSIQILSPEWADSGSIHLPGITHNSSAYLIP